MLFRGKDCAFKLNFVRIKISFFNESQTIYMTKGDALHVSRRFFLYMFDALP